MDDLKLDFSKLDAIGRNKRVKDDKGYNYTSNTEKSQETANTGEIQANNALAGLQNTAKAYQVKNHAKKTAEQGRDYIRKSEHMRAQLAKDAAAGASDIALLLKALYCIALMTGDRTLFNQIVTALKANHEPEQIDAIIAEFDN